MIGMQSVCALTLLALGPWSMAASQSEAPARSRATSAEGVLNITGAGSQQKPVTFEFIPARQEPKAVTLEFTPARQEPKAVTLDFVTTRQKSEPVTLEFVAADEPKAAVALDFVAAGQEPKGEPQHFVKVVTDEHIAAFQEPKESQQFVVGYYNQLFTNQGQNGGEDISLAQADTPLRVQLKLPKDQGLVVTGLAQGGQAAATGLCVNDILLTIDGKPLAQPDDLDRALKAAGEKSIELRLLHHGQPKALRVKPLYRVSLAPAEPEPPAYFIGVQAEAIDGVLRDHLHLGEQKGLVAADVVLESPAAKAGVQKGDLLLEFADKPLADVETLVGQVQSHGGKPTVLKVLRGGKTEVIAVTPERRKAEETKAEAVKTQEMKQLILHDVNDLTRKLVDLNAGQDVIVLTQPPQGQFVSQALDTLRTKPADPVEKRLDELNAEVKALHKAIEELRKAIVEKK